MQQAKHIKYTARNRILLIYKLGQNRTIQVRQNIQEVNRERPIPSVILQPKTLKKQLFFKIKYVTYHTEGGWCLNSVTKYLNGPQRPRIMRTTKTHDTIRLNVRYFVQRRRLYLPYDRLYTTCRMSRKYIRYDAKRLYTNVVLQVRSLVQC